jgi:hypothetical protein
MPRLRARRPVRRGVLCAFRSRAAVDVLFSAGLPGLCAKRSGRGLLVDLMPRTHVYATHGRDVGAALCCRRGRSERVEDGRRNVGGRGSNPGTLGGMVAVVAPKMVGDAFTHWCSGDFRHRGRADLRLNPLRHTYRSPKQAMHFVYSREYSTQHLNVR